MIPISEKTKNLRQSGIRSATQKCLEIQGINLGQGLCDLPTPQPIKDAVSEVLASNLTKYSACEGVTELRQAVAQKAHSFNKMSADKENVMIAHGSTGAFICAVQTVFNPGDEVILFEPFYGYHKKILNLFGISTQSTKISMTDFSIDLAHLESLITSKIKGIVICTPCNPCGKVFTKDELMSIGNLANKHNLTIITDEIYEYITYPGHEHISIASLGDFQKRTITISGFSKTYNMTGWRLGYAIAAKHVIEKMSLLQDLLYVCPSTPMQYAALKAFELQPTYFDQMRATYLQQKNFMVQSLKELGFAVCEPQGAYYIMADFSDLGFHDDTDAADQLLKKCKVATVTGGSFFENTQDGKNFLRFCFALNQNALDQAVQQLKQGLRS